MVGRKDGCFPLVATDFESLLNLRAASLSNLRWLAHEHSQWRVAQRQDVLWPDGSYFPVEVLRAGFENLAQLLTCR